MKEYIKGFLAATGMTEKDFWVQFHANAIPAEALDTTYDDGWQDGLSWIDMFPELTRDLYTEETGKILLVVTQEAYPSNNVFPHCFQEAEEGEEYISEYVLKGHDKDGQDWEVVYRFMEIKGEEKEPDSLPWENHENIHRIQMT